MRLSDSPTVQTGRSVQAVSAPCIETAFSNIYRRKAGPIPCASNTLILSVLASKLNDIGILFLPPGQCKPHEPIEQRRQEVILHVPAVAIESYSISACSTKDQRGMYCKNKEGNKASTEVVVQLNRGELDTLQLVVADYQPPSRVHKILFPSHKELP